MSLFTLYVFSKPFESRNLGILLNNSFSTSLLKIVICHANRDVSMLTPFRITELKIKRHSYLVQEITKPGETCHSCKETLTISHFFFVLILELDSHSNKH